MKRDFIYKVAYIIATLIVVFSAIINDGVVVLLSKVFSLALLLFLFVKNTYKINYWYLLSIMILMITDSLLIFEFYYLDIMMSLLLVNKIIYTVIISSVLKKYNFKKIIKQIFFYLVLTGPIFYQITNVLDHSTWLISLFYIAISVIGGVSFVNLMEKQNLKSRNYFIAMFLIYISEAIIGITVFVEESMIYMPIAYLVNYIGRYILYTSMILKGK